MMLNLLKKTFIGLGSGCGSVGRAVASDKVRGSNPVIGKKNYIEHLFTVNCILKRQNEEKEAGNGPFKKTLIGFHSF